MKALAVFEESKANGHEYAEIAIKSKRNSGQHDVMMKQKANLGKKTV